jgi:predicted DCC family thiol-disulfide oxidoreductase YuxK
VNVSAAATDTAAPIVLFDGVCNLCNGAVTWIIERDRAARFVFGALQSASARVLLDERGVLGDLPDSIVLLDADGVHTRSDAALRIAAGLGWPWSLLRVGRVLPRGLRDAIYDLIARNRYRWFGRREACMMPTAELANRFLD